MYLYIDSYKIENLYQVIDFLKLKNIEYHIIPDNNVMAEYKARSVVENLQLEEVSYNDYGLKPYHIDRFKEICSNEDDRSTLIGLMTVMLTMGYRYRYMFDTEAGSVIRNILEIDKKEFNTNF